VHNIVKILQRDDGELVINPRWCLVYVRCGGETTFCTGEYFGESESDAKFECKAVKSGGITCESCLREIKLVKSIRL